MKVPLLDLTEQNSALEAELRAVFAKVLESGRFILGEEVEAFEAEIAAVAGTQFAVGASSGTDALLLALMALGIGPGDEVICPSFTFFATAGCVSRTGATPVFADSCPVCFNIDLSDLESRITSRTRAIIPVHLFGQAAAMEGVMRVGRQHGLRVIEDAAQSIGARYGEQSLGSIGDIGTFSFFPTKNLGAFGDAGMLVTDDAALAEKARVLRNHGAQPKYHHALIGGNFRLDALQAALLRVKLPHLESYTSHRRRNAADYTARLGTLPGVELPNPAGCGTEAGTEAAVILPAVHSGNDSIWNQYTIRVRGEGRRDALIRHLGALGIGYEIYYPIPLHRQECFRSATPRDLSLPRCEAACREVLSLPVYPELSDPMRDAVIEAIAEFLEKE